MTIRGLIHAIERGDMRATVEAARAAFPDLTIWRHVLKACEGSLDAAKALHDALLPGWEWHLGPSNAKVYPYNGSPLKSWGGMADNPARAWLLAILRAQERSEG